MTDPAPPAATLEVKTSFFFLAFLLAFFKPKIAINGQEYTGPVGWGVTSIPLAPGQYQVEAWVPYLFYKFMGRNGAVVDVPPGAVVRFNWRCPYVVFLKGKVTVDPPQAIQAAPPAA